MGSPVGCSREGSDYAAGSPLTTLEVGVEQLAGFVSPRTAAGLGFRDERLSDLPLLAGEVGPVGCSFEKPKLSSRHSARGLVSHRLFRPLIRGVSPKGSCLWRAFE